MNCILTTDSTSEWASFNPTNNAVRTGNPLKSSPDKIFVRAMGSFPENVRPFVHVQNCHRFDLNGMPHLTQFNPSFCQKFGSFFNISALFPEGTELGISTLHRNNEVGAVKQLLNSSVLIDQVGTLSLLPMSMAEQFNELFKDLGSVEVMTFTSFYKGSNQTLRFKTYTPAQISSTSGRFFLFGINTTFIDENGEEKPAIWLGFATFSDNAFKHTNSIVALTYLRNVVNDITLLCPELVKSIPASATVPIFQYYRKHSMPPGSTFKYTPGTKLQIVDSAREPLIDGKVMSPLFTASTVRRTPVGQQYIDMTNKYAQVVEAHNKAINDHATAQSQVTDLVATIKANSERIAALKRELDSAQSSQARLEGLLPGFTTRVTEATTAKETVRKALEQVSNTYQAALKDALKNPSVQATFNMHQIWAKDGFIVKELTFLKVSDGSEVSSEVIANAISEGVLNRYAVKRISFVTTKPMVISNLLNAGTYAKKHVAGPFRITITNAPENNIRFSVLALDDRTPRAVWVDGSNVHVKIYPHINNFSVPYASWKENSLKHWQESTKFEGNLCAGELAGAMYKAMMSIDLTAVRTLMHSYLTTADLNDAWGKDVKKFPLLEEVDMSVWGESPPAAPIDITSLSPIWASQSTVFIKKDNGIEALVLLNDGLKMSISSGSLETEGDHVVIKGLTLKEEILCVNDNSQREILQKIIQDAQRSFAISATAIMNVAAPQLEFPKFNMEDVEASFKKFKDKLTKKPLPKPVSAEPAPITPAATGYVPRNRLVVPPPTPVEAPAVTPAATPVVTPEPETIPFDSIVWPNINSGLDPYLQFSTALGNLTKAGVRDPRQEIQDNLRIMYDMINAASATASSP